MKILVNKEVEFVYMLEILLLGFSVPEYTFVFLVVCKENHCLPLVLQRYQSLRMVKEKVPLIDRPIHIYNQFFLRRSASKISPLLMLLVVP